MTPQQLQHLRDTGHGWVADEIELLRKENAELKQRLAEAQKLNLKLTFSFKAIENENKELWKQLAEAQKQNEQARVIVELVAHIGVDFGYGPFVLDETHIAKARAIFPSETK